MSSAKRRLTSKNLFDDVFATIPADCFLRYGPESLMEELAMQSLGEVSAASHRGRLLGNGKDDDDDEVEALMNSSLAGRDADALTSAPSAVPRWSVLAAAPLTAPARRAGHSSVNTTGAAAARMVLEMDSGDAAYREATRHAALLSEVRESEARMDAEAQARRRQRFADQVAAQTTDEERHGSAGVAGSGPRHGAPPRGRGVGGLDGGGRGGGGGGSLALADGEGRRVVAATLSPPAGLPRTTSPTAEPSTQGGVGDARVASSTEVPTDGLGPAEGAGPALAAVGGAVTGSGPRRQLTAEEQLALMPPGLSLLYSGRCVMLRGGRGFGFIAPDLGGPDVYFIKDSVVLSFTRLALQAFYRRHGMPIPTAVLLPEERWSPPAAHTVGVTGVSAGEPRVVSRISDLCPPTLAGVADEPARAHAEVPDDLAATAISHASSSTLELNPNHHPAAASTLSTQSSAHPASPLGSAGAPLSSAALDEEPLLPTPVGASMGGAGGGASSPLTTSTAPIPPITHAERERADAAAALLTHEGAQLLLWAMESTVVHRGGGGGGELDHGHHPHGVTPGEGAGGDPGGVVVSVRDALTFTVQRNRATGGASRLLRAEFIRGPAEAAFALALEQHWFYPLFPDAIGIKSTTEGGPHSAEAAVEDGEGVTAGKTSATAPSPLLVRYSGSVRAYNAEDRRGYIRCDEREARQDVCFSADSFLWDPAVPPAQRVVSERMRVRYSVAGMDRNHKYLATLVTSFKDGRPFARDNILFADDEREGKGRRGGGGEGGGRGGGGVDGPGSGGSHSGMGGGAGAGKRAREEEQQMLLFEDDDYAMI